MTVGTGNAATFHVFLLLNLEFFLPLITSHYFLWSCRRFRTGQLFTFYTSAEVRFKAPWWFHLYGSTGTKWVRGSLLVSWNIVQEKRQIICCRHGGSQLSFLKPCMMVKLQRKQLQLSMDHVPTCAAVYM